MPVSSALASIKGGEKPLASKGIDFAMGYAGRIDRRHRQGKAAPHMEGSSVSKKQKGKEKEAAIPIHSVQFLLWWTETDDLLSYGPKYSG